MRRPRPDRHRRRPLAMVGLWLGAALSAAAQTVPPSPEPPRPAFAPALPDGAFRLPPVAVPPADAADPDPAAQRFVLRRVEVRGATVVPDAALQAGAAASVGQPVGLAELEALRLQLTRLYVERGYVNSGLLLKRVAPDEGLAEFEAVEGRLVEIRLRGMGRLDEAYVARQLRPPGDGPLNLDRLRERFQLLLGDPLFASLNARLMPGTRAGEAVLEVDVVRARPWQLTAFVNNHRPVSVGADAAGLSGWVRNLTGRGDMLEATVQGPADGGADLRGSLAWRVPLGRSGTSLSVALDSGRSSVVEESVRSLDITSRLTSREIGLAHTLTETLGHRFAVGLQAVQRENRTWLLGSPFSFTPGEPDGEVRERLWRFWQEATWRSETEVLALRSTFTWGRNNLQPVAGLPPLDIPATHYRVWLGQAHYARQLATNGAQVVARVAWQHSPDRLLALDGMAIGGVQTVRGYRENQLVRDLGVVVNLELEWPLWRDDDRALRVVGVPFVDVGHGRHRGEPGTTLASAGLALRASWHGWHLDLALAGRIDPPEEATRLRGNLQDRGVHLQLSYRF